MKILLTGGTGQVGTEIRRQHAQWPSLSVDAPDRAALDLAEPAAVLEGVRQRRPDFIISSGAYTAVDRAESEPDLAHRVNATSVAALAQAAAELGIPVLHLSTDYVFPGDADQPYREADATGPTGVYGASKLAGEVEPRRSNPKHLILRVSWVFAGHGANFLRTMLRLGRERDQLKIVADQRGGPTYAGHIAQTCLKIAEVYRVTGQLPWGTYHYSGAPDTSWFEFAGAIFDQACQMGLLPKAPQLTPITTLDYPTPARRPANSRLDCGNIAAALGIQRPSWAEGVAQSMSEIRSATD